MRSWMDKIRQVVLYTLGEQPNKPDMIKLNTNENLYPPAPGIARALKMFNEDRLRVFGPQHPAGLWHPWLSPMG